MSIVNKSIAHYLSMKKYVSVLVLYLLYRYSVYLSTPPPSFANKL